MSTPPPPPGYGTLPPDPNEPARLPYPTNAPYPGHPVGPPPGLPGPYGGPGIYAGVPPPQDNTLKILGIVALVAGIIAIPASCCCWFIGWIPALVAVGSGAAGLAQLKNGPSTEVKPFLSFLIAGLVLGAVGLLLTLVMMILGFANGVSNF